MRAILDLIEVVGKTFEDTSNARKECGRQILVYYPQIQLKFPTFQSG